MSTTHDRDKEPDRDPVDGPLSRLLGSSGRLLATVLTIGRTRLELLTVELQLEVRRLAVLLALGFVALFSAGVGLMLGGMAVILMFWDTHRVMAAWLVTACFGGIALLAALALAYKVRTKPRLLDSTLTELAADSRRLRGLP